MTLVPCDDMSGRFKDRILKKQVANVKKSFLVTVVFSQIILTNTGKIIYHLKA